MQSSCGRSIALRADTRMKSPASPTFPASHQYIHVHEEKFCHLKRLTLLHAQRLLLKSSSRS